MSPCIRRRASIGLRAFLATASTALLAGCVTLSATAPSSDPSPSVPRPSASPTTSAPTAGPTTRPASSATSATEPSAASASPSSAPSALPTAGPTLPRTIGPDPSASPTVGATARPNGSTSDVPARFDARLTRRLGRAVEQLRRRYGVPGMAVAVRLPGGQTHVFLSGHASLSPDRPVTRQTVFAVASVSKTFVAALILQLAEEDRLSLDDVIGRYVPGAPKARSATIRQLLSHRSGIYDYFESPRYAREVFADPDRRWTYEDIMGLVKSGYCPAGQCYHYSNTNYVILGRIAEVVTGRPLHELLRERFFDPLGLDDTVLQPFEPTPRDAAHGHWTSAFGVTDHTRDSEVIPHMAAASVANAAGAIASTARDLVRWTAALYGGDVLSRRSRKLMAHVQPPDAYGLGTRRAWFAGRPALGHRGGIRGFESSIWYFPRDDLSIAITSNRGLWTPDVVVVPRVLKILSGPG